MNESDRELVFSQAVKAGKRIYYFDVKQSRNGDRYISITESKKIVEGTYENPRISFEKHKLFLYKEDYEKFVGALVKTLEVAKTGIVPVEEEVMDAPQAVAEVKAPEVFMYAEAPEVSSMAAEETEETTPVESASPAAEQKSEPEAFKIDLDF